uniref:ARAD1D40084p n=1 Tax=Blastobotrys adeninivorans TaxID=409370 RepID=A0A060TCA9_BLAAD
MHELDLNFDIERYHHRVQHPGFVKDLEKEWERERSYSDILSTSSGRTKQAYLHCDALRKGNWKQFVEETKKTIQQKSWYPDPVLTRLLSDIDSFKVSLYSPDLCEDNFCHHYIDDITAALDALKLGILSAHDLWCLFLYPFDPTIRGEVTDYCFRPPGLQAQAGRDNDDDNDDEDEDEDRPLHYFRFTKLWEAIAMMVPIFDITNHFNEAIKHYTGQLDMNGPPEIINLLQVLRSIKVGWGELRATRIVKSLLGAITPALEQKQLNIRYAAMCLLSFVPRDIYCSMVFEKSGDIIPWIRLGLMQHAAEHTQTKLSRDELESSWRWFVETITEAASFHDSVEFADLRKYDSARERIERGHSEKTLKPFGEWTPEDIDRASPVEQLAHTEYAVTQLATNTYWQTLQVRVWGQIATPTQYPDLLRDLYLIPLRNVPQELKWPILRKFTKSQKVFTPDPASYPLFIEELCLKMEYYISPRQVEAVYDRINREDSMYSALD